MDYYSLFWRLGVIATINEPWGALTCRSSTLTVLADCCPFRGVLLTVLDPGVISTLNESRGVLMCRSSTLTVLLILARFMDYSLFSGPKVILTINEPRGALTCRSSTFTVLADSGPVRGLLLTVLASRSDFHH